MRTTVTIDRSLLEELQQATGEKSKSAALNKAAEEYLRREKLRDLKEFWMGIRIEDVEMKRGRPTCDRGVYWTR